MHTVIGSDTTQYTHTCTHKASAVLEVVLKARSAAVATNCNVKGPGNSWGGGGL